MTFHPPKGGVDRHFRRGGAEENISRSKASVATRGAAQEGDERAKPKRGNLDLFPRRAVEREWKKRLPACGKIWRVQRRDFAGLRCVFM